MESENYLATMILLPRCPILAGAKNKIGKSWFIQKTKTRNIVCENAHTANAFTHIFSVVDAIAGAVESGGTCVYLILSRCRYVIVSILPKEMPNA